MKHDLADKWGERILILEAQLEREPTGVMVWHWRGEARVLRFLVRRYGHEPGAPAESIASGPSVTIPATSEGALPEPAPDLPTSALERSLLRLALLIPNVATKHARPAPQHRAEILERIRIAREEGRATEDAEESWWEDLGVQARRNALLLREREERWKRRERECKERERKERERR